MLCGQFGSSGSDREKKPYFPRSVIPRVSVSREGDALPARTHAFKPAGTTCLPCSRESDAKQVGRSSGDESGAALRVGAGGALNCPSLC